MVVRSPTGGDLDGLVRAFEDEVRFLDGQEDRALASPMASAEGIAAERPTAVASSRVCRASS